MSLPLQDPVLNSLGAESRLWLALSGGLDSVVLLHWVLSQRNPAQIQAIHVHHHLCASADAWVSFCQALCDRHGISLRVFHAKGAPSVGESIEAWAREQRRACFQSVLSKGDFLLTAHHADDQAETLLLQLLRGAGLAGLAAMPSYATLGAGTLYRPFLSIPRSSLKTYAKERELSWVEDESNESTRFDRNFLRHKVMPILHERFPAMAKTMTRSAEHCAQANGLISALSDSLLKNILEEPCRLDLSKLEAALAEAPYENWPEEQKAELRKLTIRQWLSEGFSLELSTVRWTDLLRQMVCSRSDSDPVISLGSVEIRRYRNCLYVLPKEGHHSDHFSVAWTGELPLAVPTWPVALSKKYLSELGLSVEKLNWSQVKVTQRVGGERCFGGCGESTQSLKKLFQTSAVPPWMRSKMPLIWCENRLVMVMGVWICKEYSK